MSRTVLSFKPRPGSILVLAALLFLIGFFSHPVFAQDTDPPAGLTMSVTVGFDSHYKDMFWTPVRISVANEGQPIEGTLQIVTGSAVAGTDVTYQAPVELPTLSSKEITMYVFLSDFTSSVTVDLLENGDLLARERTTQLRRHGDDGLLYGVISDEPDQFAFLEDVAGRRSGAAVAILGIEDLPDVAAAWNSLDVLIFNDVDTGRLTPVQLTALQAWVETGGQLVVTGGSGWQRSTAAFTDQLPVTIRGTSSVEDLTRLRALAGEPYRTQGPFVIAESTLRSGTLLVHEDGLPILARERSGRGTIYFLALDPTTAPLRGWRGNEVLWHFVGDAVPLLPFYATGVKDGFAIRDVVRALAAVTLPSIWLVACFLGLYVVVVGPLNYLVIRRLRRRELAWLTIPAIIFLFCGATYFVSFQTRGSRVGLNQMNVAFGQTTSDTMRVNGLFSVYSPQRSAYDVTLPENVLIRPFQNSFTGGVGEGGRIDAIVRGNGTTIEDIRVDVSGSSNFLAETVAPMPELDASAALRLDGSAFLLDVSVTNRSSIDLEQVSIMFGSTVTAVGELRAGESYEKTLTLTALQASAVAATTSPGFGFAPATSTLQSNADVIVGSAADLTERELQKRRSFINALHSSFAGPSTADTMPRGTVTLIAWSDEAMFAPEVAGRAANRSSTTLYMLELPFIETIASGTDLAVTGPLVGWSVLDSSNTFAASPFDLYLYNGTVDFEFTPLETFSRMRIERLTLSLEQPRSAQFGTPPALYLWDWREDTWVRQNNVLWGDIEIDDLARYLGTDNAVRVRLQNDDFREIEIRIIYPTFFGDLEEPS